MKLVLCKACQDVVRLIDVPRTCRCGKVGGHYVDDLNAVVHGEDVVVLGFDNDSLRIALSEQKFLGDPEDGKGITFAAFIIPKKCSTVSIAQ